MVSSPPAPFSARFEEKIIHNQRFVEFHFELEQPHRMPFRSGQYVSLKVNDAGVRRSYSISSVPSVDHGFEFLIDVTPGGIGTQLLNSLEFGQTVQGIGPLGQFVLSDQPESAVVLLATGSGISPLKSMLLDLVEQRIDQRPITLYWGMRYAADLFWLDDFQDIVEANTNVSFYPVISQPEPEWNLSTGHVTDLLQIHHFPQDAGYYICGSQTTVQSIQQFLLAKSVQPQYIHHEKFY